jgi:hypothetical protein
MPDTPQTPGTAEVLSGPRPVAGQGDAVAPTRTVSTRLIRRGDPAPSENDWASSTPSERIAGVWELTRQCLAWNREGGDDPRLERDITRVIRRGR